MTMTPLQTALRKLDDVPPQTRIEVIRGINIRRKKSGLPVMSLHYSAIPDRDPETEKGAEWFRRENGGYASQAMWKKEQEMDPTAMGGEAVFNSVLADPRLYQMVVISDPNWFPDPRWDVVGGFDHGVTNATALLKGYIPRESWNPVTGQKNPTELYLCGEFYRYRTDEWSNNVDENVIEMRKMHDLERARWILADPSIFYDSVATDVGAPTNIYQTYKKNGMWPMAPYQGVRSDVTFVEWIMSDYWRGLTRGRKPRLYIVCRNPSDRPQPGLHQYDCPNLLWEMKRAKRVQMTSRQLLTKNPSEALENKNNHAMDCLSGDTLVTCRRGQVRIDEVKVGEEVLTRAGWRPVEHSWLANLASEVYRVRFSDGREIIGTARHRFFTPSSGFVRLDELKAGTLVACLPASTDQPKPVCGWESGSIDIPKRLGTKTVNISRQGVSTSTSLSGYSSTSARCQQDITCTTKTRTHPITSQTTLRQLKPGRTWRITTAQTRTPKKLGNAMPRLSARSRLIGIDPQKVERGTANTGVPSAILSSTKFVRSVALLSKIRTVKRETLSARLGAGLGFGLRMSVGEKNDRASSVERSLLAKNPQQLAIAHLLVGVSVVEVQKSPLLLATYDLTVQGEHEFFANGLLVHNCLKAISGALRSPTEVPGWEGMDEELSKLEPTTQQFRARFLMSELARQGKLDPATGQLRKGKPAVRIDMRRSPGTRPKF